MAKEAGEKIGSVRIADDVVPVIAALAAAEVEGVVSVDNSQNDLMSRMGVRKAPKGVKVDIVGRTVKVDMALGIHSGYKVPETCREVQEKVKTSIETMTNLEVIDVNVRIASVVVPAAE